MTDLSPRCWFCDEAISADSILADGFLAPRTAKEGGPLRILGCPACGHHVGAERNAAGDFLLVPVEDLGFTGRIGALFDGGRAMRRAHARAWFRTHAERRREFHAAPPKRRAANAEPLPRRPKAAPGEDRSRSKQSSNRDERSQTDSQERARPTPRSPTVEEFYVRLDLEPGEDAAAVAKAFRRLSKRCHPDKVAHLDEDFQALAHRKFTSLQEAYDGLMRHLNP